MDSRERIATRDLLVRVTAPARQYAFFAGVFLVALGLLSLVLEYVDFETVGPLAQQPEFLTWKVNGWTAVFWMAMGMTGLLSVGSFESARSYALGAGVTFAAVAAWGFIAGNDVLGVLVADTTNNVTHAALAGAGLLAAAMPPRGQIPSEPARPHGGTGGPEPPRFERDRRPEPGRITGRR